MDDRKPEFWSSFPADIDASPGAEPAVGAFDWPAVAAGGVGGLEATAASAPDFADGCAFGDRVACSAWSADAWLDRAGAHRLLQRGRGIAAVGPELAGRQTTRLQSVKQRQQMGALVLVAGTDPDRKRGTGGIDG